MTRIPPRHKRVTPNCCERVRTSQAVYLAISVEWRQGNRNAKPVWCIAGANIWGGLEAVRADFCPFCGAPLPEIVRVPVGRRKFATCSDGGYYCDTCGERLRACECFPPTHQWGPANTRGKGGTKL